MPGGPESRQDSSARSTGKLPTPTPDPAAGVHAAGRRELEVGTVSATKVQIPTYPTPSSRRAWTGGSVPWFPSSTRAHLAPAAFPSVTLTERKLRIIIESICSSQVDCCCSLPVTGSTTFTSTLLWHWGIAAYYPPRMRLAQVRFAHPSSSNYESRSLVADRRKPAPTFTSIISYIA